MSIIYGRAYDEGLRMEITKACYKSVIMKLEEFDDFIFIHGVDAADKNKGECQEMISLLREDFKGKRLCASPPVSDASKHIFDKMGVNYTDCIK